MKQFAIILSILFFQWAAVEAQPASGATEHSDTSMSRTLGEVVVSASRKINKIDRQVILPSQSQIKASSNGLALLQNLQLDRIVVNPIEKSVKTTSSEEVQLRINGVEATIEEVQAIRPDEVKKVEYHDNPGLRYGHVAAVIDYIVRHKDYGGNVNVALGNGISKKGWGEYRMGGKYNRGKSTLQLRGNWRRRKLKWTRENYETFVYPDSVISHTDLGNPTGAHFNNTWASLAYSYTDQDRQLLNITFRNRYNSAPTAMSDRNSTQYQGSNTYHIIDHKRSWEEIPSLDVYYQRAIGHNQQLYFDLVGTLMSNNAKRHYQSIFQGDTTSISSHIRGQKQSLIGEAIYEKQFSAGKLTAGLRHMQSHMSNTYLGEAESRIRMNTAKTYGFVEYQAPLGSKLNYTLGMGLTRTYNSQGKQSQENYVVHPTLTVSCQPTSRLFMRYKFYVSGYSPSLSQLSDVVQGIDVYQSRRGNPNLKTTACYSNTFDANWKNSFMSVSLWARYSYDHKPVMDETVFEDGIFIRTFANQKAFHSITVNPTFQFSPLGEHLQMSFSPSFNRYISHGNSYTHTYNNWSFEGDVMATFGHWMAAGSFQTRYNRLMGEEISYGEEMTMVRLGYTTKKWEASLDVFMPFSKHYSVKSENVSQLAPYRQNAFTNAIAHFLVLNVSFNLDFGKPSRDTHKRINNADTDNGVLSGAKQ